MNESVIAKAYHLIFPFALIVGSFPQSKIECGWAICSMPPFLNISKAVSFALLPSLRCLDFANSCALFPDHSFILLFGLCFASLPKGHLIKLHNMLISIINVESLLFLFSLLLLYTWLPEPFTFINNICKLLLSTWIWSTGQANCWEF